MFGCFWLDELVVLICVVLFDFVGIFVILIVGFGLGVNLMIDCFVIELCFWG